MQGMGLIVLHSGHFSKIFQRLMGTGCNLKWRAEGEKERLWLVNPAHPIGAGVPEYFEIEREEMYGEHFDVPAPDELVFISWFAGGDVFRSGCCYHRGQGKIFYFRPGHEFFPTFYHQDVQQVIYNACCGPHLPKRIKSPLGIARCRWKRYKISQQRNTAHPHQGALYFHLCPLEERRSTMIGERFTAVSLDFARNC
jgi:trehalose utilization protein